MFLILNHNLCPGTYSKIIVISEIFKKSTTEIYYLKSILRILCKLFKSRILMSKCKENFSKY